MVKHQFQGLGHQIKGAVKEGIGKLIGDAKLSADGTAERASGQAQFASAGGLEQKLGIDADRIMGVAHQLKGSLKAGIGSAIGNAELESHGVAERAAGKAQNEAGSTRNQALDASGTVDLSHTLPPV